MSHYLTVRELTPNTLLPKWPFSRADLDLKRPHGKGETTLISVCISLLRAEAAVPVE